MSRPPPPPMLPEVRVALGLPPDLPPPPPAKALNFNDIPPIPRPTQQPPPSPPPFRPPLASPIALPTGPHRRLQEDQRRRRQVMDLRLEDLAQHAVVTSVGDGENIATYRPPSHGVHLTRDDPTLFDHEIRRAAWNLLHIKKAIGLPSLLDKIGQAIEQFQRGTTAYDEQTDEFTNYSPVVRAMLLQPPIHPPVNFPIPIPPPAVQHALPRPRVHPQPRPGRPVGMAAFDSVFDSARKAGRLQPIRSEAVPRTHDDSPPPPTDPIVPSPTLSVSLAQSVDTDPSRPPRASVTPTPGPRVVVQLPPAGASTAKPLKSALRKTTTSKASSQPPPAPISKMERRLTPAAPTRNATTVDDPSEAATSEYNPTEDGSYQEEDG